MIAPVEPSALPSALSSAPPSALIALVAPVLAAFVGAVVPALRRRALTAGVTIAASLATLAASLDLLFWVRGGHQGTYVASWLPEVGRAIADVGVRVDGISAGMLVVVAIVALCVQVFSLGYLHDEPAQARGRYFTYHALFLFSMNLLVLAPNLLQFFAGWELVGVTSYLLIGYYWKKPSAARAAQKAFWVTKLADMGFVVALLVLFVATGGFGWESELSRGQAEAISALLFLAVMGKSAQFPLHVWLPDAMEGPTPVSALLHAATMVAAGVYLIVRAHFVFVQSVTTEQVMMLVGAGTALFAASLALVQKDLKKVLAYSTCSQLGYMVCALGAGAAARLGGYFHLTTHAFFKALLFLAAGSVIHAVHSNDLSHMGGLRRRMPLTTAVFTLGTLALAGVPPLSGFFSKDMVLIAVEGQLGWVPYLALVGAAFLTAFYMGRVLFVAFFGPASSHAEHAHEHDWSIKGPLILLAVPTVVAGFGASQFASLTGEAYHAHFGLTPILASAMGIGGFLAAWLIYRKGEPAQAPAPVAAVQRLADTAAVNKLYELIFRRVFLGVARLIAWFDRYVIDGLMNALGYGTVRAGSKLRRIQTGDSHDYLLAVMAGVVALVAWGLTR